MNEKIGDLELILLNIGYSEMNANWNWKSIYSPFARIYHVTGGAARTYIGDKMYSLEPGNLYLTPPFTLHDDECDSFFSLYYIHFYEKAINKESIFDIYDFPIGMEATPLDLLLTKRLLDINPERHLRHYDPQLYDNPPTFSQNIADNSRMPVHSALETRGILYQLTSKFLVSAKIKSRHMDDRVNKCLQYIHENVDKTITVNQLADIACITEDHFIRIFKKEMRCTPIKYINSKKIEKAQLLLLTTDMPIKDIAFDLSADNISYFNRIFKQHTGKTPGQYREEFNK
jgi:Transcriptional regulator containing an amidase domain and an AraC-type DNA-binding HTH domain